MLTILAAFICVFVVIGNISLNRASESFAEATIQNRAATRDIGMSFDWYGLTIVNTAVQYNYDIIDSSVALQTLRDGQQQNKKLLMQYFKTSLPEERKLSEYIYVQNIKIDKLVSQLAAYIGSENKKEIEKLIPTIFSETLPICDAINESIALKTENAIQKTEVSLENIRQAQTILILLFALFISLCAGIFMPDVA